MEKMNTQCDDTFSTHNIFTFIIFQVESFYWKIHRTWRGCVINLRTKQNILRTDLNLLLFLRHMALSPLETNSQVTNEFWFLCLTW